MVADAEINDHGEEEEEMEDLKELLSKGPVQAIPEGSVSRESWLWKMRSSRGG